MDIREAKPSDKELVLDFCNNTFEWGDYIDRTWEDWISDPFGLLLVYEIQSFYPNLMPNPVAMIHVIICSGNILWLEGLRVNKVYRKKGIATKLLQYGINYGLKNGIKEFGALVSKSNFDSQKILEKIGFLPMFNCEYYNIRLEKLVLKNESLIKHVTKFSLNLDIKIPLLNDIPNIQRYLLTNDSAVSACKYFDSWRLCNMDSSFSNLFSLVNNNEILLIINQYNEIVGLVIIKSIIKKYGKSSDESIIQISYLNFFDLSTFFKLIHMLLKKHFKSKCYTSAYFFLPAFSNLGEILNLESIDSHDSFYLYMMNSY